MIHLHKWTWQRAERWYNTCNPFLKGMSPKECVLRGQEAAVMAYVKRCEDENDVSYEEISELIVKNVLKNKRMRKKGYLKEEE